MNEKGRKAPKARRSARTGASEPRSTSSRAPGRRQGGARRRKRPVLRFVLIVGSLMLLFNLLFCLHLSEDSLFGSYLQLNARICAAIINVTGDQATVTGTLIRSPRFALEVKPGCDGIQASAFFIFAVLASPVALRFRARLPAVVLGTALLLSINLLRLISLYYAGIYVPSLFEILHVEVWQVIFIFLPIVFWLAWERRATRGSRADAKTVV